MTKVGGASLCALKKKQFQLMQECVVNNFERGIKMGLYRTNLNEEFVSRIYFVLLSFLDRGPRVLHALSTLFPETLLEKLSYPNYTRGIKCITRSPFCNCSKQATYQYIIGLLVSIWPITIVKATHLGSSSRGTGRNSYKYQKEPHAQLKTRREIGDMNSEESSPRLSAFKKLFLYKSE